MVDDFLFCLKSEYPLVRIIFERGIFCAPATTLTWTHKTNVVGTLNMLGLAKRIGARFLLTSTSEVYGDPLEHPQKGEHLDVILQFSSVSLGGMQVFEFMFLCAEFNGFVVWLDAW